MEKIEEDGEEDFLFKAEFFMCFVSVVDEKVRQKNTEFKNLHKI